ncbi:hypothetical protein F2Q68_00031603 [Brassica cretica]|uniref:Uncharacterized protein n=1 Tax=Brassica cretica TaxID=69181 RepID=A0A8S9GDD6_BRACR|nr:hypothetical protein F2Q68_00031603 [Brassica cretica]
MRSCLNGIQSTKIKEVRNGMAKDVLFRFGLKGYKSHKKMKEQQDRRDSCPPDALISYLFGPWCEGPSIRAWTRHPPSRALLVDLLDRLEVL